MVGFLNRVRDAVDTPRVFEYLRAQKTAASRRKIRSLVRRELEPVSFTSLPGSIQLSRRHPAIDFIMT